MQAAFFVCPFCRAEIDTALNPYKSHDGEVNIVNYNAENDDYYND